MIYHSGNVYNGEWKNGHRHGCGSMTYKDGRKETRIWKYDEATEETCTLEGGGLLSDKTY
jgi:hypothetical protein